MKVSQSIRDLYQDQWDVFSSLSKRVENVFLSNKNKRWHFEGRIKELESYALKLETGRCTNSAGIDDFYACTIVVENLSSIKNAESLVDNKFNIIERRPRADSFTHKRPETFPFDDLRLYVEWRDEDSVKPSGLNGLMFEVQIKTFLQHAWSIATHDLVYKTNEKNWAKERIAFQIKAMLEHAEISISEADTLSMSGCLTKVDSESKKITKIINKLNLLWTKQLLPLDIKRLAQNINSLLTNMNLSLKDLIDSLTVEGDLGRGVKTLNLSPYGVIVQTLINQKPAEVIDFLNSDSIKFKLLIHRDIEIPVDIDVSVSGNVVFLS